MMSMRAPLLEAAPFYTARRPPGTRVAIPPQLLSGRKQRGVVLDRGERVVEVMEEGLPLLVRRRAAEAPRVILERGPPDEQQITVRHLEAATQLVALVAGRARDQRLGARERRLEASALARAHAQHRHLEAGLHPSSLFLLSRSHRKAPTRQSKPPHARARPARRWTEVDRVVASSWREPRAAPFAPEISAGRSAARPRFLAARREESDLPTVYMDRVRRPSNSRNRDRGSLRRVARRHPATRDRSSQGCGCLAVGTGTRSPRRPWEPFHSAGSRRCDMWRRTVPAAARRVPRDLLRSSERRGCPSRRRPMPPRAARFRHWWFGCDWNRGR